MFKSFLNISDLCHLLITIAIRFDPDLMAWTQIQTVCRSNRVLEQQKHKKFPIVLSVRPIKRRPSFATDVIHLSYALSITYMGGSRGGRGSRLPHPLKITKIYGFLTILVRIPWKTTKLPNQYSILGHHRHLNGVSLACRWLPALVVCWILTPFIN